MYSAILCIRWFLPSEYRHHSRFIPFGQLCPFNLHPVTHKVTKKSPPTGHEMLDKNKSLYRIQSYSPNLRSPHGTGGVQKIGETLMDIRTFVRTSDAMDKSYISLSEAAAKSAKWSKLARSHIKQLRTSCGMARLELTFLSKDLQSDKVFTDGISTVINTFVKSTKVYSAELVADLAEISLLGFEGVSSALLTWFQGSFISVPLCWNTFSEVWQYLTFVATNFFSGRRCYDRKAFFTPRLGYLFSRPVVNPSWVGINAALVQICSNEENLLKLKNCWYESSGMTDYFNERRGDVNRNIIDLSGKFDTKFKAFLELLETRCDSAPITLNEAVACSYCKTITSKLKSEADDWKDHRCDAINPEMSTVIDLKSPEFTKYLIELSEAFSASQKEAMEEILLSDQSCFLTGVAGSGKSYLLKCLFPSLILKHGYSSVFITATTNIAASNINGITLSRFMGLIVNDETDHMLASAGDEFFRCLSKHHEKLERHRQDILQNVTLCEVIIIDEAGMCDLNTFCFLNCFLQFCRKNKLPFGGVRIILVGDVLQLPPISKARKTPDYTRISNSREGEFFFQSRVFGDNFFVAYLRENHRQADPLFLNALNQVRIGDSVVVDYLNNIIFQNKCTSWSTLDMARSKNKKLINDDKDIDRSNKVTLKKRIDWGFLLGYRNNMKYYDEEIFKKQLDNAPRSNFSDLVVCLEHAESDAYTEISCEGQKTYRCHSTGTISSTYKPIPAEVERHFNAKLPQVLTVYVGMPCRVTYRTSHANVCSNTIVVIKKLVLDPSNSVESIIVATTSPDHNEITVTLFRVTITESYLSKGYIEEFATRTQFPIISSIGLLPWNLQCLTISDNIFYDNTRSCATEKSNKASLYAVMSRVKSKDQISFLFPVSTHEISNGVNLVAKRFDDQYRLKDGVIFKVAKTPSLL